MNFSFVIPTYNRCSRLQKTLASLFVQTFQDFEIIVVDDGSTDETSAVVSALATKESRLLYIQQEQRGASKARNVGVKHAKGEYVVYIDSDDIAHEELLKNIYDHLNHDARKTYGLVNHIRHIVLLDSAGHVIQEHPPFVIAETRPTLQDYYHWNVKTTSSGFFHKRSLWPNVRWDETLSYLEDWELLLQLGHLDEDGFLFIQEPLVTYTQSYGGDGMCSNAQYADWATAFDVIYHKHKDDALMVGQTWWPERIEKYMLFQAEVDEGKRLPQVYKYFPNFKSVQV